MKASARRAATVAVAIAAAVAVGFVAVAHAATPLPPRTDRSVFDVAGVIDDATEARLEALHRELFTATQVAIVVIAVPRLEGETIDQLAVRVGQTWGVGDAAQDRGVVVAFARDDRKIFVATGYGVEGVLPDGRVGSLLDRYALPALRQDDFSTGLARLSAAIADVIARDRGVTLREAPELRPAVGQGSQLGLPGVLVGIVVLLIIGYLAVRHPGTLALLLLVGSGGRRGGGGSGDGDDGFGGFGGGGFGGGGGGRSF